MRDIYENLEELCELTGKKLSEATDKLRSAQGRVTQGDMEYLDTLTHMLKSIKTTMAMMGGGSSYDGKSYDGYYGRSYDRDSMGRYSGRMYRDTGTINKLRKMMEETDDDRTREEFQRFIEKMEHM